MSIRTLILGATLLAAAFAPPALASDHLDTAAVIADPAGDIGDLYAWTSADGRHLDLVMTIVGNKFSDHVRYQFHVDSARRVGGLESSLTISCEFNAPTAPECHAGDLDYLRGEAGGEQGILGEKGRFRVFAGLRDDPFFNNVRGSRAALNAAGAARHAGTRSDAGGCPAFDRATVAKIHDEWRHTEGKPGSNFLAGWNTAALVVEIDLDAVTGGGSLLGVWATTAVRGVTPGHPRKLDDGVVVDRMGRALTGNMLLGTFDTEEASDALKTRYNQAVQADWPAFAKDLVINLAIYDGFDGRCGNQWLAVQNSAPGARYEGLATMLADDRLWVNSAYHKCHQYLAAEFDHVGDTQRDCGGRTPGYDAVDVFRSLLAHGTIRGLPDGVDRDDATHSDSVFPFLAKPAGARPGTARY
ncbi:MAG TPA: DUF4331 family protein [Steroidobacteraceae bacterium]|nr:DUF4331 family protein [Steroidobacteraceae bacterium]